MHRPRIRTFSVHCRERYGQTVGKIPLDLGIPCPNRARGGCLYCQPASFTPAFLRAADPLAEQISRGKASLLAGRFTRYFAYFQQETPTALATIDLLPHLQRMLSDPDCLGLILSTRPDTIAADLPAALADLIQKTGKACLVELGVQSIHDRSLRLLNRNHCFADFLAAVDRLHAVQRIEIGAHLILGIPGESEAEMLATVRTVCALPLQHLKLHHLQVIRDTPLHRLYTQGQVPVWNQEAYLELLLRLVPHIPAALTLHRLWSTAHPHLLVAPRWHCHAAALSARLQQRMVERGIWQGQRTPAAGSTKQGGQQ
ncbi:Radical SAM domain protein [Desulfobulbus propionicus DSM 2032]|uniref:Radical SAM domain protein n=1 Tax=Desulfobulbus propionicus (strain ATCC 33891 / DSM 2032 / VKM B-1956 / 1pr3) TaxID=577650 RepID=A0A7U3YIU5_DESPD|nr:TIGR01212 family radical SAM protein [Desulfobulbus propionicus]ADW16218.1 Radical SAM domain protein [Desulfobulbus propionicus DSM 2032]